MPIPKIEIKKILYATDLSENARHAFAYAVSLAGLYGAEIILLHVIPEFPSILDKHVVGYIDAKRWAEIKAKHFQDARAALIGKRRDHLVIKEVLDKFCEDAREGQDVVGFITDEVVVERGNPDEQILTQAEERNCDLIVMGTHGHGTLADTMMGSTAQRVLRRSRKPVLVIRLPDEGDE
jgi:nucleotide-binding universal stress UspA family protein